MVTPSFGYFEHDADMGVIGRGATLEQAFEQAALAVFAIVADIQEVQPLRTLDISVKESNEEFALVEWLNALLAAERVEGLVFGGCRVARKGDAWVGQAWGEPWREGLERGVEVKGATLTMLSVQQEDEGAWEARCVVDV